MKKMHIIQLISIKFSGYVSRRFLFSNILTIWIIPTKYYFTTHWFYVIHSSHVITKYKLNIEIDNDQYDLWSNDDESIISTITIMFLSVIFLFVQDHLLIDWLIEWFFFFLFFIWRKKETRMEKNQEWPYFFY